MNRLATSVSTRFAVSSRVAASRRFLRPQRISVAFFSSSESPQLGKPLTAEELAERRAQRAERRAAAGKEDEEKNDTLFIEGSVRAYQRHYVIVEPQDTDPNAWPAKLERSPEHIMNKYMGALVKIYGGNINKVKESPLLVTAAIPYTGACSGGGLAKENEASTERREEGAHDILVFPDDVRVHNVVPSQISILVNKSLEKDLDLPALLEQENLQYTRMEEGYHMMVCGHAARDERCGCKGPELLRWLKDSTAEANKPLNLWTSSHYGGHRYAAACIVYPSGDWFGLLNEEDKAKSMIAAMNDDDPLRLYELWRGRMGLTVPEMHQAVKERVETPEEIVENA